MQSWREWATRRSRAGARKLRRRVGGPAGGPALARGAPLARLTAGFNFGPTHESNRTVAELVGEILRHWPGQWQDRSDPHAVHEANLLQLSTDKAHALLGWSPVWNFPEAIEKTIGWYRRAVAGPGGESALPALTLSAPPP